MEELSKLLEAERERESVEFNEEKVEGRGEEMGDLSILEGAGDWEGFLGVGAEEDPFSILELDWYIENGIEFEEEEEENLKIGCFILE